MIKELAFVVYAVRDVPRATAFYRDVVGLKPGQAFNDGYVEFDVGGQAFAIDGEPLDIEPGSQRSATFEVDDVAAERDRLAELGVPVSEVLDFPICLQVLVTDPDGNRISLHQRKARSQS
jgi:predicted enzyme related to lactoylglutathione lyase